MADSARVVGVLGKLLGRPNARAEQGREPYSQVAGRRGDTEKYLGELLEHFKLITTLDELWNAGIARGLIVHDAEDEREISDYYHNWLLIAEDLKAELNSHRAAGHEIARESEWETCLQDARGINTPDEVFFAGPALETMRDRAIEAYHEGQTVELRDIGD